MRRFLVLGLVLAAAGCGGDSKPQSAKFNAKEAYEAAPARQYDEKVKQEMQGAGDKAKDAAKGAADKAKDVGEKIADAAKDAGKAVAEKGKDVAEKGKEVAAAAGAAAKKSLVEPIQAAYPKVEEKIKKLSGDAATKAAEKFTALKKLVEEYLAAPSDKTADAGKKLTEAFAELKKMVGVE